jgi:hypothetical protein
MAVSKYADGDLHTKTAERAVGTLRCFVGLRSEDVILDIGAGAGGVIARKTRASNGGQLISFIVPVFDSSRMPISSHR